MPSDIDSFGQCLQFQPVFPHFLPLLLAGLASAVGAIWIIRQKTNYGQRFLNISLVGMLIWIAAISLKAMVDTPACEIFWSRTSYLGVGMLPPAWVLFAYRYATGERGRTRGWQGILMWGSVLLTIAVVWTNPWHVMFYGPGSGFVNPETLTTIVTKGPLYWPLIWFYYAQIMLAVGVLAYCIYRSYGAFRLHFIVLAMLTLLPLSVSMAYTHLDLTVSGVNPTPFAIVGALVLYVLLISDNQLSQTASLAKEQVFLDIPNPMVAISTDGRIALANHRAIALFAIAAPYRDIKAADIPALAALTATLMRKESSRYSTEIAIGSAIFELHASHVVRPLGRGDPMMGWLLMFFDVTERRRSQTTLADELTEALRQNRRIMDEALSDPLTGLLNRRALAPQFDRLCALAAARDSHVTLTLLDLDHFKAINDNFGHATGDLALTILAEGMHKIFRKEDLKFRIGGEEFVILSADLDVPALRNRLDALRDWVLAEGARRGPPDLSIRFSAGIALDGVDRSGLDLLLSVADERLYTAKMAGRNRTFGPDSGTEMRTGTDAGTLPTGPMT